MQNQFFVSHNGQIVGSYTLPDIAKKIENGELDLADYIYDETKSDWVSMLESQHLQPFIKDKAPTKAPPSSGPTRDSQDSTDDYFVLRGENQIGPYPYNEILKMLQEKVVFEFDYVWKPGMESWRRIAELVEFAPQKIKVLKESGDPVIKNIFFRRRFKRKEYGGTLIIHDNKKVWHGKGIEISEGGAGLVMHNSMVLPGQTLYLHFRSSASVPAFNALVEVVSKKYLKGANNPDAPISYGVRFLKIGEDAKTSLQSFVSDGKRAA